VAESFDILQRVKSDLGLQGNDYHDATIAGYIAEVKQYLIDGGVNEGIVNDEKAAGLISRGVSDLWNYGAGNAALSPYFKERAVQLALKVVR
jgi:hypothetical protein